MSYRIDSGEAIATTRPGAWQRRCLPSRVGACVVDRLALADGVALVYSDYRPREDLVEVSELALADPVVTLTVGLEGRSGYRGDQADLGFVAGQTTVTRFQQARGERRYRAGERVRQLRLMVAAPALARYRLDGLLGGPGRAAVQQLDQAATPVPMQPLVARLEALYRQSPEQRLELEITALSLLSAQVQRLVLPSSVVRSPRDREAIRQVRALMVAQPERPWTLAMLSQAVGINEAKLKAGVRAEYDTTPFRLLTAIRMQRARELLQQGHPVATAAYRSGYSHPANFSLAFKRFFGESPKVVAQHPDGWQVSHR
ncbi:helix-turn-helix transcriptional regulator [Marinobacter sp. CA1]|uniref:helix-turn-helix transcriptional regulator n=1 Tax=Marinobacter sp. CA1 TaxID=2817656 RepID=UPI00226B0F94|nr:AraC family transcriptional regulator [Marinobacter sp. CA1]UDL05354.1 helix-turn-helix transcriptional regulator [Marinobacter sp. CA1]